MLKLFIFFNKNTKNKMIEIKICNDQTRSFHVLFHLNSGMKTTPPNNLSARNTIRGCSKEKYGFQWRDS